MGAPGSGHSKRHLIPAWPFGWLWRCRMAVFAGWLGAGKSVCQRAGWYGRGPFGGCKLARVMLRPPRSMQTLPIWRAIWSWICKAPHCCGCTRLKHPVRLKTTGFGPRARLPLRTGMPCVARWSGRNRAKATATWPLILSPQVYDEQAAFLRAAHHACPCQPGGRCLGRLAIGAAHSGR